MKRRTILPPLEGKQPQSTPAAITQQLGRLSLPLEEKKPIGDSEIDYIKAQLKQIAAWPTARGLLLGYRKEKYGEISDVNGMLQSLLRPGAVRELIGKDKLFKDTMHCLHVIEMVIKSHQEFLAAKHTAPKLFLTDQQIKQLQEKAEILRQEHESMVQEQKQQVQEASEESARRFMAKLHEQHDKVTGKEFEVTRDISTHLQKLARSVDIQHGKVEKIFQSDREQAEGRVTTASDYVKKGVGVAVSLAGGRILGELTIAGLDFLGEVGSAIVDAVKEAASGKIEDKVAARVVGKGLEQAVEIDLKAANPASLNPFTKQMNQIKKRYIDLLDVRTGVMEDAMQKRRTSILRDCQRKNIKLSPVELENLVREATQILIDDEEQKCNAKIEELGKKLLGDAKDGEHFSQAHEIAPLHALSARLTFAAPIFKKYAEEFSRDPKAALVKYYADFVAGMEEKNITRGGGELIVAYIREHWGNDDPAVAAAVADVFGFKEPAKTRRPAFINKEPRQLELERTKTARALMCIFKMFDFHCHTVVPELMEPAAQARAILDIVELGQRIPEFHTTTGNRLYQVFDAIKPMKAMLANVEVRKAMAAALTVESVVACQLDAPAAAKFLELEQLKDKNFVLMVDIYKAAQQSSQEFDAPFNKLQASYEAKAGIMAGLVELKARLERRLKEYEGDLSKKQEELEGILGAELKSGGAKKGVKFNKQAQDEQEKQKEKIDRLNAEIKSIESEIPRLRLRDGIIVSQTRQIRELQAEMQNIQIDMDRTKLGKRRQALLDKHLPIENLQLIPHKDLLQLLPLMDIISGTSSSPADMKFTNETDQILGNCKSVSDAQAKLLYHLVNATLLTSGDPKVAQAKRALLNHIVEERFLAVKARQVKEEKSLATRAREANESKEKLDMDSPLSLADAQVVLEKTLSEFKGKAVDFMCFGITLLPLGVETQKAVAAELKKADVQAVYVPVFDPVTRESVLIEIIKPYEDSKDVWVEFHTNSPELAKSATFSGFCDAACAAAGFKIEKYDVETLTEDHHKVRGAATLSFMLEEIRSLTREPKFSSAFYVDVDARHAMHERQKAMLMDQENVALVFQGTGGVKKFGKGKLDHSRMLSVGSFEGQRSPKLSPVSSRSSSPARSSDDSRSTSPSRSAVSDASSGSPKHGSSSSSDSGDEAAPRQHRRRLSVNQPPKDSKKSF